MSKYLGGAVLALAIFAAPAQATVYDLAADFSNASNPNGVWSFVWGSPLAHYAQPSSGPANPLNGAAADGYWGTGPDFFSAPFLLKATADGSDIGNTDDDFLTGNVLVHGPNDGSAMLVTWTAPTAGTIDLNSSLWYAHSAVQRSAEVVVTLGSSTLGSETLTNGMGMSNAASVGASGLTVAAGDVLTFAFSKSTGQQYGSLAGIDATIDFTAAAAPAVPEPASWALMIGGFALAGGALRQRREKAALAG